MDNTILAHRIQGEAGGLPLVLVHPLGADGTFWRHCLPHFGDGILSVSCDLRGSGSSPDLSEPLTLERTSLDIDNLRQFLGFEKIVLVGCAVGAMAAAHYACRFPETTEALIMSNPGFKITAAGKENLMSRAALVRSSGMTALLPGAIENAFIGYQESAARADYEKAFIAQKPENYAYAAMGAADADISGDVQEISCPMLLTPGRNDKLFPIELHADEIMRLAPHAALVEFANGAHFIPYQQGEEFGRTVSGFLEQRV